MRRLSTACALLLVTAASGHLAAREKGKAKKEAKPVAKADRPAAREQAGQSEGSCSDSDAAALWWSPLAPALGAPIKILAVGVGDGELTVSEPQGGDKKLTSVRRDGPPSSLTADFTPARAGSHQLVWRRGGKTIACRKIPVAAKPAAPSTTLGPNIWPTAHAWDRRYENFYSAWIATLFDAPVDQSLDFRPLHQALRDPARNFLYGYLGLREDDPKNKTAISATPDCADLPYFLRAYFSWKQGLPFGFRDCDRGTESRPPRCTNFYSNDDAPAAKAKDALAGVKGFFRQLANRVQSGSARTGLDDDATDYYPVPLERTALRPGVIYADPYGHDRPEAVLGGDVFVRERRQERRPRVQGVPPAGAGRRRQAGADDQRGDRPQGRRGARAVLRRAKEGECGRLLRAHGQADQPVRARRGEGIQGDAGRAGRADDGAGRVGRQR
jgi:hypothetical protein